ncbi:F0F1 ATP synthase subunit A [Liquorilactobacillus satsumensis]|uniref:ATP synthase subunit a n=1 Tax=Liquorilactobacillus satsumensis DSM 16230 = JCM 12392 TaxID=1423801 RepID=A0A0R1V311_9LACO|nr:F0F1 ATP synthase subunit A [Liquorilactobacillus satsumensis]KRL97378.1 F0F1 ATP synthase subunit A [Liquorilactobacillus satsumensis DSM 16230 = JCM 12392]MCC7667311.1 F0F1 ATP synthase subunit A [Liquorilactobacillus satsumensis]MCP9312388.1 F0F1 ATP synthase subunit A [Liquorilactobacillus satsumensis]MCP9327637.1 F0F1 ATP synthase subunit A [Liquorilactobacillus satsumensis]MCP9357091.1 F0F1 ATP synthase subunit A [Liquorilactobacillus satsumensis]
MNEGASVQEFFGIPFNISNDLPGLVAAMIVFFTMLWLSRRIQLKPSGRQNFIEWIIDFTNGIIKSTMPGKEGSKFGLLIFTLFSFIFVSNQLGLMFQVDVNDVGYIQSPTANAMTTMTLAFIVLLTAHFLGVKKFGFKGYFKNTYLSPLPFLLPLSVLEEFTNFLTLALRLYGNIYSGEVLLKLIYQFGKSFGIASFIPAVPLEIIWQGFSVFIGSIQAYVFVTLTMVYISQKVEKE